MVNCGLRAAFVWLCKPHTIEDHVLYHAAVVSMIGAQGNAPTRSSSPSLFICVVGVPWTNGRRKNSKHFLKRQSSCTGMDDYYCVAFHFFSFKDRPRVQA